MSAQSTLVLATNYDVVLIVSGNESRITSRSKVRNTQKWILIKCVSIAFCFRTVADALPIVCLVLGPVLVQDK